MLSVSSLLGSAVNTRGDDKSAEDSQRPSARVRVPAGCCRQHVGAPDEKKYHAFVPLDFCS